MSRHLDVIASVFFGFGMGLAFPFIALASLLTKENLFLKILDHMDDFWRSRGYS